MANTWVVKNRDEFNAISWRAQGGDKILLEPGEYSGLRIRDRAWDAPVTISSADTSNPATVNRLQIDNTSNVVVTGLDFRRIDPIVTKWHFDHLRLDNVKNVTVTDNTFKGGIVNDGSTDQGWISGTGVFSNGSENLTVADNDFEGVHKAVRISAAQNARIVDNDIHDYREDGIFAAGVTGLVIERNVVQSPNKNNPLEHLDIIQLVGIRDGVVRNNFLNQADGDVTQAILLGRGGYDPSKVGNVLIENNIIHNGHHHGISNYETPGVTIRNNIVLWDPHKWEHVPTIGVYGEPAYDAVISGNVTPRFWNTGGLSNGPGEMSGNVVFSYDLDGPIPAPLLFMNPMAGAAATIADFAPYAGGRLGGFDFSAFDFIERAPSPEAPTPVWRTLDLEAFPVAPLANGQDQGAHAVLDGGNSLEVSQNAWKIVPFDLTIAADTALRFDFEMLMQGEIYGVGLLQAGSTTTGAYFFQLAGSDVWESQTFRADPALGQRVSVEMPLGRIVPGEYGGLIFFADDDADGQSRAIFSNVAIGTATDQPVERPDAGEPGVAGLSSFADQDFGRTELLPEGGFRIVENGWKQLAIERAILPGTTLLVDVMIEAPGEIHAVGLTSRNEIDPARFFQFGGSQDWGIDIVRAPLETGIWTTLEIPVGVHLTGSIDRLVFVSDDDASAVGSTAFRNVRWSERDVSPVTVTETLLRPFAFGEQDFGWAGADSDGRGLKVGGNGWTALQQTRAIESDTVLVFDFRSESEGEFHAIGFETDDVLTESRFYRLSGDQPWGRTEHLLEDASVWTRVAIPVGERLGGQIDRLVFAADDDDAASGVAHFRNIEWTTTDALYA